MSPETKAFGTLMVIFNVCPKVKKNPSKVGNLVCKLWDSNATEGFYLLLLFLFSFFFSPLFNCSLSFQKTRWMRCLHRCCSSAQHTAFSLPIQTRCALLLATPRRWIIVNKKAYSTKHWLLLKESRVPLQHEWLNHLLESYYLPRWSNVNWIMACCQLILAWPTIPLADSRVSLYHTFFCNLDGKWKPLKKPHKCHLTSYHELKA